VGNNWPQLHLLLAGPFVLRDDVDGFRILIPDLMDTHFNPGFTATHNAAEVDNGAWNITFNTGEKKRSIRPVKTSGKSFDIFWEPRLKCSSPFATLKLPTPDLVHGLSPANAVISSDTEGLPSPMGDTFATRAALIYDSVDLSSICINPTLKWDSPQQNPDLEVLGSAGAAVLTLDMQPLVAPTSEDHAMMAYRNMARMVGVNRFMRQGSAMHSAGQAMDKGKYNDCGAAMILISPPPEEKTTSR
jgi:hypothetical protein